MQSTMILRCGLACHLFLTPVVVLAGNSEHIVEQVFEEVQQSEAVLYDPDYPAIRYSTAPFNHYQTIAEQGWLRRMFDWNHLGRREKVVYANGVGIALVTLYGLATWDYGNADLQVENEGWFGLETKSGGADKMGHLWSSYAYGDLMGSLFRDWGYDRPVAAGLSALSSWLFMGAMEVGDSSSPEHGFSVEDTLCNSAGVLISYFLQRYPDLDRKFDLRVHYELNVQPDDIFTDYENTAYVLAMELGEFEFIKDRFLHPFELQLGYYTRGWTSSLDKEHRVKDRMIYVGISVDLPLYFGKRKQKKTQNIFRYLQPPLYSPIDIDYEIDEW